MLPLDAASSLDWMSRGACRSQDPELFFPIAAAGPALRQTTAAKAVCGSCTVRPTCLSYALDTRQDGIWGGTTTEERLLLPAPSGWQSRQDATPTPGLSRTAGAARGLLVRGG